MKPRYLFILLFSVYSFPADAQNIVDIQDPAAEPYLNSLSKLFDPEKAYQIEFRYEVESKIEGSKVSDYGSVIIKGQKYKLKLEDGEMYYNGEKIWVYNKESAEVYTSIPEKDNPEQMLLDPFRLLSMYKVYYKYRLKGEITMNQNQYINIELYPKNLETSYSILRVWINKKTRDLYSFEMQEKKGVIYKITVIERITPVNVDDSVFIWNPADHPDVLEIEM